MRLLLHIGTHRTGTTTIQRFASKHRTALKERRLWYPGYEIVGANDHYAHLDLAHGVAGLSDRRLDFDGARRFFDAVRQHAGEDDTVLISSEPFYRHTYPETAESSPEYWQARERYVRRTLEVAGDLDIEIVLVLRRQDAFAQSMYNEHIKATRYGGTFEQFIEEKRALFEYHSQIRTWQRHFSQLRVLVFEDLVATGDLVAAFFDAFGISTDGLEPVALKNASLTHDLVEIKRHLNRSFLSRLQLRELASHMTDREFARIANATKQRVHWTEHENLVKFLESFRDGNRWICDHYLDVERDELFPHDQVDELPRYPGLDPSRWPDITLALLHYCTRELTA